MNEYGYNTLAEAISNFEQQMPKLDRSFSSAVPAEDAATGGSKVQYDNLKQVSAKLTIQYIYCNSRLTRPFGWLSSVAKIAVWLALDGCQVLH